MILKITSTSMKRLASSATKRKIPYPQHLRSASSIPPLESNNKDLEHLFKAHTELQSRKATQTKPLEVKIVSNVETRNEFLRYESPTKITFPGDVILPITSKLNIVLPNEHPPHNPWSVFRLMVRINKVTFC